MWRRIYLLLVLLRLYFALSPSYLHPDEHFQGPEVIAGRVFSFPVNLTWEFTSENPIRSIFPLWLLYGWPLTVLKWLSEGIGYHSVPPFAVFYALRALMFVLSFVLEDWALHELLPSPKERQTALLLVASSYVTWTFQTHTFSNSMETLIVLWCIVLVKRIKEDKQNSQAVASALLAFLCVLGTFNRITFPAFVIVPLLNLLPHFRQKPSSLIIMIISASFTFLFAVSMDTEWYTGEPIRIRHLARRAVITPWNNFMYNSDPINLAKHGTHPYYQHFAANLPQLLGPAAVLLLFSTRRTMLFYSGLCGVAVLSIFSHQEARFLLPTIPLFLSSIRVPQRMTKIWVGSWLIFNLTLGLLMGVYHQGGVVPAQLWVGSQSSGVTQVFWWKTYSPPGYLLGTNGSEIATRDLMGMRGEKLIEVMSQSIECDAHSSSLLIAPLSATFLDPYASPGSGKLHPDSMSLEEVWRCKNHLNLDDMDFGDDGVVSTLSRVIGRRGIGIWKVHKHCGDKVISVDSTQDETGV